MNEIQIFNNPKFGKIRTSGTSDQPLFCLADVCAAVGIANHRNVKNRLDQEDVYLVDTPTPGGVQAMAFVTESGLYDVIIRSDSEKAKPFRKWVTSEVLPAIRKTGGYMVASEHDSDEVIMARALVIANQALERRDKRIAELERINLEQENELETQMLRMEVLEKQASYFQCILQCPGNIDVCQIAQDYGMSAIKFNKLLRYLKIQYKQNKQWILYAPYKDKGYVHSRTIELDNGYTVMQTQWTQKGRKFLYNILKRNDILPLIEKQN